MTDQPKPPDFAAMMQAMLPGLTWQPSTLDKAGRAQAAAAADALHKLNAPLEQTVAPYLSYVEQLERYASGGSGRTS